LVISDEELEKPFELGLAGDQVGKRLACMKRLPYTRLAHLRIASPNRMRSGLKIKEGQRRRFVPNQSCLYLRALLQAAEPLSYTSSGRRMRQWQFSQVLRRGRVGGEYATQPHRYLQ